MVGLGFLAGPPEAVAYSAARDISADGSVVVGSAQTDGITQAFLWTQEGGMAGLGDLPGDSFSSGARAVSADGSVVVGISSSSNGHEAFRWTANTGIVGLGDLAGGHFISTPFGASADGSIVVGVGHEDRGSAPFRWTAEKGMVALHDSNLPRIGSALGMSADGNVIVGGGISPSSGRNTAYFWTPSSGWRELEDFLVANGVSDFGELSLSTALAVSADGRTIIGTGNNAAGRAEAWVATIPEPSTIVLAALASAATVAFAFVGSSKRRNTRKVPEHKKGSRNRVVLIPLDTSGDSEKDYGFIPVPVREIGR
jgi:probable HAF family extracellular repeat protein